MTAKPTPADNSDLRPFQDQLSSTPPGDKEKLAWTDTSVQALVDMVVRARERKTRLEDALRMVTKLFFDPAPFYIKKLGGPMTLGDQSLIDAAFIAAEAALEDKP